VNRRILNAWKKKWYKNEELLYCCRKNKNTTEKGISRLIKTGKVGK